jgi:uncharacterized integral membrane protein
VSNLPVKPSSPEKGSNWKPIVGAVTAIYAAVLLLLNNKQVPIRFVFFTIETSLIFLMLLSMGLGALLALFGPAWWRRRQRMRQNSDLGA